VNWGGAPGGYPLKTVSQGKDEKQNGLKP
jgi:hypothetical protein